MSDIGTVAEAGLVWTDKTLAKFTKWYWMAVSVLIVLVGVALTSALNWNANFHHDRILGLAAVSLALWAMLVFAPSHLAKIFLLGLPFSAIFNSSPSWNPAKTGSYHVQKAKDLVDTFTEVGSIAALLLLCNFGVLSLITLSNPVAYYLFLFALAGQGIWMVAFNKKTKILEKVTYRLLWAGIIIGIVSGTVMVVHPQDQTTARIERALMVRADAKKDERAQELLARVDVETGKGLSDAEWEELNAYQAEKAGHGLIATGYESVRQAVGSPIAYEATREVSITSTDPQKVCGIKSGNRSFTISTVFIRQGEASYELTSYLRINGQPGQRSADNKSFSGTTRIRGDGCFNLTFAMNPATFQEQTLALTFR